jgi:hypothetical protein
MEIKDILKVVSNAAKGNDDIKKGIVGSNGFGFMFKDPSSTKKFYVKTAHSSKFCTLSFYREIGRKWDIDSLRREQNYDIYLTGCIKTLVPSLKIGGYEHLFFSWVYILTPGGRQFPATFYFGQSGMCLGGWKCEQIKQGLFPKNFASIINSSPFDFSESEIYGLVDALEHGLKKVPVSDYYGVYEHDLGQTLMGIKYGKPLSQDLYRPMNDEEVKSLYHFTLV